MKKPPCIIKAKKYIEYGYKERCLFLPTMDHFNHFVLIQSIFVVFPSISEGCHRRLVRLGGKGRNRDKFGITFSGETFGRKRLLANSLGVSKTLTPTWYPQAIHFLMVGYQLDDEPHLYLKKLVRTHRFHPLKIGCLGFQEWVKNRFK